MGKRIIEIDFDDLTGEEGVEVKRTVIVIDGYAYTLDLTERNMRTLRDGLTPFLLAAQRPGMTAVKNSVRVSGHPTWLDERQEAPAPEPTPDPPKGSKPKTIGEVAQEARQEKGSRTRSATRPAGATAVPQTTFAEPAAERNPQVDWAQWAPSRTDDEKAARRRVRAWCWAKGYSVGTRGAIPGDLGDKYQEFYRKRSNWAPIPPALDMSTTMGAALGAAEEALRQAS